MARSIIPSLCAVLALAACAHRPPTSAAAPAGMRWSLLAPQGEGAKLVFGAPQSDDVLLMLSCEPRSGEVRLAAVAGRSGLAPGFALASGDAVRRYPAHAEPSGVSDGLALEATTPATDPVLAGFAASGRLTLELDGRRTTLPEAPGQARAFLASCRG